MLQDLSKQGEKTHLSAYCREKHILLPQLTQALTDFMPYTKEVDDRKQTAVGRAA